MSDSLKGFAPIKQDLAAQTEALPSRAEEQASHLERGERRFRALIEHSADAIVLLEASGTVLYTSPATERILGGAPDYWLGASWFNRVHPDDLERMTRVFDQLMRESGSSLTTDFRYRHLDGSWVWLEATGTNLLNEPGINAIVGNFRDISERKHAEAALASERNMLRTLIDNVPDYMYIKDTGSRFVVGNLALAHSFGKTSPEELYGKTDLDFHPPELAAQFLADEQAIFRTGQPQINREEYVIEPAGNQKWLITTKVPLRDNQRNIVGLAGVGRDVTERRRAEQAAHEQRALAEALRDTAAALNSTLNLDELLDRVLANLSRVVPHDAGNVMLIESGLVRMVRSYGYVERSGQPDLVGQPFPLTQTPILQRAVATRQAVLVPDTDADPEWVQMPETDWIRSDVKAPIRVPDQVVGFLVLDSATPGFFGANDVAKLQAFADQVALAIQNVRLFEQMRQHAQELALLYDAGLALNSVFDPPTQLAFLLKIARRALRADRIEFFRCDHAQQLLTFELGLGGDDELNEQLRRFVIRLDREGSLVWQVIQDRIPLNVPDVLANPQYLPIDPTLRSGLWVPVERDQHLLGILAVLSSMPAAFTPADERLLILFANQAAVALENARLFDETTRRAAQLSTMLEIGRAVSTLQDVDGVLEVIYQQVQRSLPLDAFYAGLYNADTNLINFQLMYDEGQRYPPFTDPPLAGSNFSEVLRTGVPRLINRTRDEVVSVNPIRLLANTTKKSASLLFVPLQIGSQIIGVMSAQSYALHAYTEEHLSLLRGIAAQAAIAIENARLYDETRRRLTELESLNRISTALRQAQSLEQVLQPLLDEISTTGRALRASIWLYDPTTDTVRLTVHRNWLPFSPPRLKRGEGIPGHVLSTGAAYLTRDIKTDPHVLESVRAALPEGEAGACVPIRTGATLRGVLYFIVRLPHDLTPANVHFVSTIAEIAGSAIHRMTLHEQTRRQVQHLAALRAIDQAISGSVDIRVILSILLEQVLNQLQVDAASVLLFNPHLGSLEYAAGRGFRSRAIERTRLRRGDPVAGQVVVEQRLIAIPDLAESAPDFVRRVALSGEDFVSYVGVPLTAKGNVTGVLEIFQRTRLEPTPEWVEFLEALAAQAAIAIDNASLLARSERSNLELAAAYDAVIEGWSRALDRRAWGVEGHTQRVAAAAVNLAQALTIPDDELAHIRRGALLHDVGEMSIPDSILHKPAPLTEGEWAIVRGHPGLAYELLSHIAHLRPALDIPYCHHEKWDGSGYPRGLHGEQIPLAARLFAIVDVWDVLVSDRPYRKAWSALQATAYLQAQRGKHFEPQLVDLFLSLS